MTAFSDRFRVRGPISVLTEQDKRQIHDGALEIMETTGVRVHSKIARDSLKRAGATVDEKARVVNLPIDLTKSLISKVPQNIVLAGREKEFDLPLDGRHCYYTTDGCGIAVWEQKSRSRRLAILQDIKDSATISDWLPYLSIYLPMVVPSDIPQKVHVISSMKESFDITRKHIASESTSTVEEARLQIRMASEIVGGIEELKKRHLISAMVCTMSPLTLDEHATDAGMIWSEAHVPVHITGMAMMGMSSPATVAGNLVVNHAETLAMVAAMQAHTPGSPAIYGSVLSNMDPRTGAIQLASPEGLLLCCLASEMARYVRMPTYGGLGSNAKYPGIQCALESGMLALSSTLWAQEINNGIGMFDCSTVLSYEQMIIDNDIVNRAITCGQEIQVSKETLHLDMIKDVGILGLGKKKGSFLGERATMVESRRFYRSEMFSSEPYDQWEAKGKKDDLILAKEKADWILKNHTPVRLDKGILTNLDQMVKEAVKL
ncbi:MAG TPA: trimethylamine methyltransferase family protein [Thermoplasmata archaeon]|nr:trimethylamine methyltransferase family protein [Thermoplasmata archaeon]